MEDATASAHVFTAGHWVDLPKATVRDAHSHTEICCLEESWHIQHKQPPSTGEGEHC